MTNAAFVQRLLAIKVQVDTLLTDAATPTPSAPNETTAPDQGVDLAAQACKHPANRRTDMRGFGSSVKRFHCDACNSVIAEG